MSVLKQSTTYTRMFLMVQSADHISALTGATCTVNLSKAGGAFGAAGGTVTEVANGWYKVALTTTDTNTVGDLAYHITATSGDPTDFVDQVSSVILSDVNTTTPPTAAAVATAVWQDATGGDFTVSSSIGKSLYTSGNAPGAASGIALVGSNMGTITGALTGAQIADAVLDRDMSSGTDSGSTTVRTMRQALRFLRNKWSISGTTLTVCKEDDATSSWTATVTATPGADPITGNDPAGP